MLLMLLLLGVGAGAGFLWQQGLIELPYLPSQLAQGAPPPPVVAAGPALPLAPPKVETAESLRAAAGLELATIEINGPLETAVTRAVGREVGLALAQVLNRALVWWVEVPGELRRGDLLEVLYQQVPGEEPVVHAVRFNSQKLERGFAAYRYTPGGARFPRMFHPDGQALELTLSPSPIDGYEQITSLIRDGRRHQGVDFKAPVGTPVKATFDGRITRKNWNFRSNGNCLELTEDGTGRTALFLHLDRIPAQTRVGDRVTAGQTIAESGNSGRSFAPHLHYQLANASGRVLDPFEVHQASRSALLPSEADAFRAQVERLDRLMTPPLATR